MVNEKDKWIDLSGLPRRVYHGRDCIHWELVSNHKVPFLYGEKSGELKLNFLSKDKNRNIMLVEYNGVSRKMTSGSIQGANIGYLIDGEPDQNHYEIGEKVGDSIIVEKILMPQGKKHTTGYILKCLETHELYEMRHNDIKRGSKSPFVSGTHGVYKENWLYGEKHLLKYLNNPEEAKKYAKRSNKTILTKCPNCEKVEYKIIGNLYSQGYRCGYCSTHASYPEKLMSSLLEMNNIEFEVEKKFEELGNYRYDFYLSDKNIVIETHGEQHYKASWGEESFNKTQESDLLKKQFCESNNITYIEIDCRKSELSFILKEINTDIFLSSLLENQNTTEILDLITRRSNYPNVKELLKDRDRGMTIQNLSEKYNYSYHTVLGIVKRNLAA